MLRRVQELLTTALLSDDPPAVLGRQLAQATDLTDEERAFLEQAGSEGLALAGLLVKKLRFEQLTLADPELAELFEQQPARFMELFRDYTSSVPPTTFFPGQEAELFHRWQAQRPGGTPSRYQQRQ